MPAEAGQTRRLRYQLADARAVRQLRWLEGAFRRTGSSAAFKRFSDRKNKMPFCLSCLSCLFPACATRNKPCSSKRRFFPRLSDCFHRHTAPSGALCRSHPPRPALFRPAIKTFFTLPSPEILKKVCCSGRIHSSAPGSAPGAARRFPSGKALSRRFSQNAEAMFPAAGRRTIFPVK